MFFCVTWTLYASNARNQRRLSSQKSRDKPVFLVCPPAEDEAGRDSHLPARDLETSETGSGIGGLYLVDHWPHHRTGKQSPGTTGREAAREAQLLRTSGSVASATGSPSPKVILDSPTNW